MQHQTFVEAACEQARLSISAGGVGAGAVLVKDGGVIARSHDRSRQLNDPIAVAEMDCIRRAGRRGDHAQLTLYSTRYPDMLCAGTILQFSIGALVVGLPRTDAPEVALLKQKNVRVTFAPTDCCDQLGAA